MDWLIDWFVGWLIVADFFCFSVQSGGVSNRWRRRRARTRHGWKVIGRSGRVGRRRRRRGILDGGRRRWSDVQWLAQQQLVAREERRRRLQETTDTAEESRPGIATEGPGTTTEDTGEDAAQGQGEAREWQFLRRGRRRLLIRVEIRREKSQTPIWILKKSLMLIFLLLRFFPLTLTVLFVFGRLHFCGKRHRRIACRKGRCFFSPLVTCFFWRVLRLRTTWVQVFFFFLLFLSLGLFYSAAIGCCWVLEFSKFFWTKSGFPTKFYVKPTDESSVSHCTINQSINQ